MYLFISFQFHIHVTYIICVSTTNSLFFLNRKKSYAYLESLSFAGKRSKSLKSAPDHQTGRFKNKLFFTYWEKVLWVGSGYLRQKGHLLQDESKGTHDHLLNSRSGFSPASHLAILPAHNNVGGEKNAKVREDGRCVCWKAFSQGD